MCSTTIACECYTSDFHVTDYARTHYSDAMIGKCENLDQ